MSTTVHVTKVPNCDLPHDLPTPAYADARLPDLGVWAHVCEQHFAQRGCVLGAGLGQRYVTEPPPERDVAAEVREAVRSGASFIDVEEIIGDGDLADYL